MDNENNSNGVNNNTVVTKVGNKEKSTNEREKNTYRNLETSMLVSATYNGKKNAVILKFYNPKTQELKLWTDETGHYPYCYSKLAVRRTRNLYKIGKMFVKLKLSKNMI